jgi:acetyltransferase
VVLHPVDTKEEDLPQTAIRPYPVQYIGDWTSDDGTQFHIRPVRPEDEPGMVHFHQTLSERTVQLRYFTPLNLNQRVSHERLSRIVFIDYDREIVLVAETPNTKTGEMEISGVARLNRSYDTFSGEFGIIISDRYQGLGLGRELLKRVIEIGRQENVAFIYGYVHKENQGMINLAEQMGFSMEENQDGVLEVTLNL